MKASRKSFIGMMTAFPKAPIPWSWAARIAVKRSGDRPCILPWSPCAFVPNGSRARSQLGYGADWPPRLAGHVGLVCSRGASAVDFRAHYLSVGPKTTALSFARASHQRRRPVAGQGRAGHGLRVVGDAARDRLLAQGRQQSVRVSRLLSLWLFDQCEAEPARHLHSASAGGGRGDTRSGDGRPDRDGREWARHGRALSSRGPLALSEGACGRGRRLRDRDAAAAAQFRDRALSERLGQR